MPLLVDITPTNIEFLFNGKIYLINEIIENGKDALLISAKLRQEVEPEDKMIEEQ